MDVTTAIGGAIATTKTVLGLTRVAANAAVDHQVKDRIIEVQQGILDIQGQLGDAQAERLQLLDEVHELRAKLRAAEDVQAALDGYVLQAIAPGAYLYASRAEAGHAVPHYACPLCYAARKVTVLQFWKTGSEQMLYRCGACTFSRSVGPSDPVQRTMISRGVPFARDY